MIVEAEIGVMGLQTKKQKDCQKVEVTREDSSAEPLVGAWACDTFISVFNAPG